MRRVRWVCSLTVVALTISILVPPVSAEKNQTYKAQTAYTFNNAEPTPAQGLCVVLSAPATVLKDESTGAAGPFRNVTGNRTTKIVLTNSESPVDPAGGENSSVDLVFRSHKSKLAVKSWWWLDENGKRIGKKQKG